MKRLLLFAVAVCAYSQGIGTPPLVVQSASTPIGAAAVMNFSTGTSVSCSGGVCTVTAAGSGGTAAAYHSVSFSATPTFTASSNAADDFAITLTGNVSSSTLASASTGERLSFKICQDATGGRTFVWPIGFGSAVTISPIASACTAESFFWDGSTAQPIATATVYTGPGYLTTQAAPSGNPASGFIYSWCDSTDLDCEIKNSAGSVFAMALKGGDYNPVTGIVSGINGGAISGTSGAVVCFTTSNQIIPCVNGASINTSGGALLTFPASTTLEILSSNARIASGGVAAPGFFTSVRWDGTVGTPTAVQSGDQLGGYNSYAYNGTALNGPNGSLRCFAAENQTGSAAGTYCEVATTTDTTTTLTSRMRWENDGGVTLPSTVTGGDKGVGTLNATGLFVNGVAVATGASIGSGCTTATQVCYGSGTTATGDSGFTVTSDRLTLTGGIVDSYTSTASTPAEILSGTWFTGGSGTTTKPHKLIECNSGTTTSTNWNTAGTGLGVNACTGFTGNLLDLQVNGTDELRVDNGGNLVSNGNITVRTNGVIGWSAHAQMNSTVDGIIQMVGNSGTGFTRLDFGSTASANFAALGITNQANPIINIVDATGGATAQLGIPFIQSTTGQRFVCVTTTGILVSSATACIGT